MGALHQVNATYYSGTGGSVGSLVSGHPDDKLGWVVGAGIKLNAPMIGQGDYFQAQVNYTEGALRYVFQTAQPSWSINDNGSSRASALCLMPSIAAHSRVPAQVPLPISS